ncbi:hypothetical protein M4I21_00630 [Cellulophaga sp. 20_2_10]|uniref:hypothetical protein n=1 Tax=Cellulophaga sp. 20_2_10 TaxID=2942476 RepID=UPI00201AC387|nr:hypothetical protein [Cellulophaga sp. 20_2_10]MCL5244294.1 hypothetical protein [Cellulophaga sp. 20_2_10]
MITTLLQHLDVYIKLSKEDIELLVENTEEKHYKASEFLVESGEKCSKIAFLITGVFRFYFIDTKETK